MKTSPFVSVITCYLNEEAFLVEAVTSVLEQDYTHWELWLVDDGSTDGSSRQAIEFARQYPGKIHYVHHPNHQNRGLSASRNLGIRQSSGELIAFLDADDLWLPHKLSQQVALMEQHADVAMLCEASEYWFTWNDATRMDVVQAIGVEPDQVYNPPRLLLDLYPLGRGMAPCPSGLMVRKELLHNRYFDESFHGVYALYEDQAFLSKVYLHEKVYVSSICTNRYRQRTGSIVQAVHESGRYHLVRKFYLNWLKNYLRANRIMNPAVHHRLQKARLPYLFPFLYSIINRLSARLRPKRST